MSDGELNGAPRGGFGVGVALSCVLLLSASGRAQEAAGLLPGTPCDPVWRTQSPMDFRAALAVYDGRRDVVVAITDDGCGGSIETWELDGQGWVRGVDMTAPRAYTAMAYDERRKVTVVYGGYSYPSICNYHCFEGWLNDMWSYDGTRWTQDPSIPFNRERAGAGMAFDRSRGKLIVHGGLQSCESYTDTWEFDGTTWVRGPNGPDSWFHPMVYDSRRETIVTVDASGLTWEYDGAWTSPPTGTLPSCSQRCRTAAYDPSRGRTVMVTAGTTWEFDGTAWYSGTGTSAPPGPMVFDQRRQRVVTAAGGAVGIYTPQVDIRPLVLPLGLTGQSYSIPLTVNGDGYNISLGAGALPPGLAVTSNRVIAGVPTQAGIYEFEILATDTGGSVCNRWYDLTVLGF